VKIRISTVAERPELAGADLDVGGWPEFMRHNRLSEAFFNRTLTAFPQVCLVGATEDGSAVADGHAVLLSLDGRPEFPPGGWEQAVVWAFADVDRNVRPTAACALNIGVARQAQGHGLAREMLDAMRTAAARLGIDRLLAPVRPTWKDREPETPMDQYARRVRADGLPYDPWLRTHVRAGGRIVGIARSSWTVAGSLMQWREWTGLPFDRDGSVVVPGALTFVQCNTAGDHAVYVEPNVWVEHRLSPSS
jgi:GNAT superfamily N-acetyltransferase